MDKAYKALAKAMISENLDLDTKMSVLINVQEQSTTVPDEMFPIVESVVDMYPDSAKSHSVHGDYLLRANRKSEALNAYLNALNIDKSRFPLWNQILALQFEVKDYQSLFVTSKECFELFPTSTTAYLLHGFAANETRNFQSGIDALSVGVEMIVRTDSDLKAEFYGQLGEAYFGLKDYSSSMQNFEKAMELDGNNASIMNSYARSLTLLNRDLELAASLDDQVLDAFPEQALFYDSKGLIEFQKGNYQEAELKFTKAVELDNSNGMFLEHLGDALAKQNKLTQAINHWKQAKDLGRDSEILRRKITDQKYYGPDL
jgi:tetratricopeptide (TPR) repeat protein